MTIQYEVNQLTERLATDTALLHQIVHGDEKTIVTTEGGLVKSAAYVIHQLEQTVVTAELVSTATANYQVVVATAELIIPEKWFIRLLQLLQQQLACEAALVLMDLRTLPATDKDLSETI